MKKYLFLIFLSLPASANINTPVDVMAVQQYLQIHHRPNGVTLIRFTNMEGQKYCQKVSVSDLNNAMVSRDRIRL